MPPGPALLARYAVRVPNWLGDALMARPLLHALRAAFANAHAVAVGPAPILELLASDLLWDQAFPSANPRAALDAIRSEGLAAAVICPPSFSSAWFAWRSGAKTRVGFAGEWRSPLLTHAIHRPERGELHLSREYLRLGEPLGVVAAGLPGTLRPSEVDTVQARALTGTDPYAIVGPGAVYGPAKRWPLERFTHLSQQLRDRGWRVFSCGAPSDQDSCEAVAKHAGDGVQSLAGQTSLAVQAALCAQARVVVCNDSGLAHLAAATGAPTVSIFGSTSSSWTAPLGPRVRVVQRPPMCSPCFQRACSIGYGCLQAVAVRDVVRAVDDLLLSVPEVA